jgi:copper chaperone
VKVVLDVENMHCGGCKKAVTAAIKNADPAAEVDVDLETKHVDAETVITPAHLVALLADAGYTARVLSSPTV